MNDFHLQRQQLVEQRLFYRVSSWPQALCESGIGPRMRWRNLRLPMHDNPCARALIDKLRWAHAQPRALVAAPLQHFNREPFAYTLEPPTTDAGGVDDFLFGTRGDFYMHYTGAMVFVLRTAGIPARVVAGYQGGELDPAGNYLLVHQFDAHAWVEYWQPKQGWLSVDPTYQVAPERVEQGLEQVLAGDSEYLADASLSPLRYRGLPWLNDMRLAQDSLNYGQQRWVLAYQGEQQGAFPQRWFGELDPTRLSLLLGTAAILSVGLLALFLLKPWQDRGNLHSRRLCRLERLLETHGLHRSPDEGLRSYGEHAARVLPTQAPAIAAFVGTLEAQCYGHGGTDNPGLRLRALRRTLP